jgi:hypothetical protein
MKVRFSDRRIASSDERNVSYFKSCMAEWLLASKSSTGNMSMAMTPKNTQTHMCKNSRKLIIPTDTEHFDNIHRTDPCDEEILKHSATKKELRYGLRSAAHRYLKKNSCAVILAKHRR